MMLKFGKNIVEKLMILGLAILGSISVGCSIGSNVNDSTVRENQVTSAVSEMAETPVATATSRPTDIPTPTATDTPVPTNTPTNSPTNSPAPTPTNTPTNTPTPLPLSEKLEVTLTHSGGSSTECLTDGLFYREYVDGKASDIENLAFDIGQTLTIQSETPIMGLYIEWAVVDGPGKWVLTAGDKQVIGGENGFLHEYIELPEPSTECVISFMDNYTVWMDELSAYSYGTLPKDVQVWKPSFEGTDFLVFSTHADDEVLFLGGVLTEYVGRQGLSGQVVYLCDYTMKSPYRKPAREHEKLNGLWTMGVTTYPVNGSFPDLYSGTDSASLEKALTQYNYDEVLEFLVENIRRFKPLIVVTQDFNGEYGHGGHKLLAKAAAEALVLANDSEYSAETLEKYGLWDTPKAYYHLYGENKIRLSLREPMEQFEGKTAIEVLLEAYSKHTTQPQKSTLFYVTDDIKDTKLDCAAFGLYRSLVGSDTANSMTENLLLYEER